MRTIKVLIPLLLLFFLSSCNLISAQDLSKPTQTEFSSPNPAAQTPAAASAAAKTPTPAIPAARPAPTLEPLIPDDLEEISVDNIENLKVFGEIPFQQIEPSHNIFFVVLSNDGTKLAAISENWENRKRSLMVWDLMANSMLLELKDQPYLWRAYFSPDGRQLWVLRKEGVDQYDLLQTELTNTVEFAELDSDVAALSPDGSYYVTGTYRGSPDSSSIRFFASGSEQAFFTDEIPYMISAFRFSPDGRMVSGFSVRIGSSSIKIWDSKSGALIRDLYGYDGGPLFSPDSTLAAFVKGDRMSVFYTGTWVLKSSFQNGAPTSPNLPQFFLGDNQILAIADTYDVSFNSASTGRELLGLPGECNVNFAASLNYAATYCSQGNIKLWGIQQEGINGN